jgi:inner membrane protein
MTGRTHDAIAFASLVTVAGIYPPSTLTIGTFFACIVGNIIGAALPDMDQESNKLWDLLPAGDTIGSVFRRVFLGHRTLSHSLIGVFIFYKIFEWILPRIFNSSFVDPQLVLASIMIGTISHLVGDALTKDGIPLFFPFPIKFGFPPIRALRITTDSWMEKYVVMTSVFLYLVWFLHSQRDSLLTLLKNIS